MYPKNIISQRQLRFAEIIREIISDTLNKNFIINSEIELGSITVSYVKLSKDFRFASVYIMPLGGFEKEKILNLINENKYLFQNAISKEKLKSKFIPKIKFFLDNTFEEAKKIEELFANEKVIKDLK